MNVKKITKVFTVILATVCLATALTACNSNKEKETKYQNAFALIEQGDYEGAFALFTELGDYKQAKSELAKFAYMPTASSGVYIFETGADPLSETITVTFNEHNLPAQSVKTISDGTQHTATFTYDDQFRFVKGVSVSPYGTDSYERFYNEKGLMYREIYTYGEYSSTYDYTYDDQGRQIKEAYSNSDGDSSTYDTYYDDKGNAFKCVYNGYGETYTTFTTFDDNGRKIKTEKMGADGVTVVDSKEFTYDANGNILKTVSKEMGTVYETFTYTYDEKGNMLTENFVVSDGFDYEYNSVYTYDEHGNVVLQSDLDSDGYQTTLTYTYKFVYLPAVMPAEDYAFIIDFMILW